MQIVRLEVFGFKSFMERLVLPVAPGITGVVGPNGCGKSNVVDALRWVLGETRASNLRGGTLEDVIFNGTAKLRPLGLAEVTLTMRSSESDFFSELMAEVDENLEHASSSLQATCEQITKDLRSGSEESGVEESEAAAESVKDEDTNGSSKVNREARPHLQVVGSTYSDDTAEAETEERESLEGNAEDDFEDSGTIEVPSGSAKSNLEQSYLARFSWLKSANEVQVTRRLYRSGESEFFINRVPCRLKDIKELLRVVGLGARAQSIIAQGEVSRIVLAKPEERRLILEEAAGVLGFREKISSANRRLDETSANVARLEDIIKEVTRQVNSLKRQANRAKNRKELKEQQETMEISLFQDRTLELKERLNFQESAIAEARIKEESSLTQLRKVQAYELEFKNELMRLDVESDSLRGRMDSMQEELSNQRRLASSWASKAQEVKILLQSCHKEIEGLDEREGVFGQRKDEYNRQISELEEQNTRLDSQIAETDLRGKDNLESSRQRCDGLREKLAEQSQEFSRIRESLIAEKSRLEASLKQLDALSPHNQLKSTIRDADLLSSLSSEVSLFANAITVPGQYARAVQAVLKEKSEYLLAQDPRKLFENLKVNSESSGASDKQALSVGILKSGTTKPEEGRADISLRPLLRLIDTRPEAAYAASQLFKNVYLSDTLDEAIECLESAQPGAEFTVVTKDGEVLNSYSVQCFAQEGGLIELKRNIEELQSACEQLERKHLECTSSRDETQADLKLAEEDYRQAVKVNQESQNKVRELSVQQGNIKGRLASYKNSLEQILGDARAITVQRNKTLERIENLHEKAREIEESIKSAASFDEEVVEGKIAECRKDISLIEEKRSAGRIKLSNSSSEVDSFRRELDDAREKISDLSLRKQKVELELETLNERFRSNYGEALHDSLCARENTFEKISGELKVEYQEELSKIRARIAREGEVDSSSIEQFELESERLNDLLAQKEDLETASATLSRSIKKLREASEQRFAESFKSIADNFSKLIPRLFGGGKGDLELSDPAHPLDSGVEIIVKPPGKKLKSIDLLSGGEKALCATALIFSMFLERPSPLCVLDEVDAPLDDANLVRFLSLVKEMSSRTQFLLITHNKQSMAVADNLTGVTMEEPGASKIISVSLQEAYSAVA